MRLGSGSAVREWPVDGVAAPARGPIADSGWSALVDDAPSGILVIHGDGRLLRANRAACELLGLDANRLLVAHTSDYFGFARHVRAGDGPDRLLRVVRPDGDSRWVQFRLVPLTGPATAPTRIAVHLTDRTALHRQAHPHAEPTRSDVRRLHRILEHIGDAVTVAVLDAGGQVLGSSAAEAEADTIVLGLSPAAWNAGPNGFDLVDADDRDRVRRAFDRLVEQPGASIEGAFRLRGADGGAVDVECTAVNLLDDPDVAGVLVTARDVSGRVRHESFLAAQAEILRQVASAAPLELTIRPLLELVNHHIPGAATALLQSTADGQGRTFSTRSFPLEHIGPLVGALGLPTPDEVRVFEDLEPLAAFPDLGATLRRAGYHGLVLVPLAAASADPTGHHATLGALLCLLAEGRTPSPAETEILRAAADLAALAVERERSERDLAHRALHDELTGLANRHLLLDRLEQALNRAKRRGRSLALMFLDLDRFKTINDTLGHDVGDQLLRQFAERLRLLVRPEDTVARFGGDEFVVLVEHVIDEQEAAQIAERLEGSMNEPFQLDEQQLAVTASVGIVIGKGDDQPAALLRNADSAMYRAKELGRNRTEMYDTRLEAHLADRTRLGVDLRTALIEGHLHLVYQPIVDLRSGEMRMIEALLRWDHPDHGRLLPLDFLAAAEDSGQGLELGAWVIERALTDLARFARHPAWDGAPGWPRPPRLVVNLSARQLAHPELVARVELALVRHHFLPQNLAVDVSERALATAGEMALRNLDHLHRIGVGIALDDVGGGPSTALLNVLERVPADILKVDPSVIASMGLGERTPDDRRVSLQRSMAAGLLGLGRGLGLTVVAEGVDQPRRVQQLRQLGFDLAQGHAIGAPVEADRMVTLLPG